MRGILKKARGDSAGGNADIAKAAQIGKAKEQNPSILKNEQIVRPLPRDSLPGRRL
jgi:hypothetical protein